LRRKSFRRCWEPSAGVKIYPINFKICIEFVTVCIADPGRSWPRPAWTAFGLEQGASRFQNLLFP
jgi:hypothetical protein